MREWLCCLPSRFSCRVCVVFLHGFLVVGEALALICFNRLIWLNFLETVEAGRMHFWHLSCPSPLAVLGQQWHSWQVSLRPPAAISLAAACAARLAVHLSTALSIFFASRTEPPLFRASVDR